MKEKTRKTIININSILFALGLIGIIGGWSLETPEKRLALWTGTIFMFLVFIMEIVLMFYPKSKGSQKEKKKTNVAKKSFLGEMFNPEVRE